MKKQIFIAVACLLFVGVLAACAAPEPSVETPEPTPTVSENPTVSDAPAVSNSPAPGNPTYTVVDGFLISDGILIEYIGKETNLVIPKEVLTITETSFSSCAKKITTLTLGDRVREIHPLAFAGMTNLEEFHTSPENPLFTYEDGVLYNRYRSMGILIQGGDNDFLSTLYQATSVNAHHYRSSDVKQLLFVYQNALFTIDVVNNPEYYPDPNRTYTMAQYLYLLTSIDFNGIHFEPTEQPAISLSGPQSGIYLHQDQLLFTQRLSDGATNTFLLVDGQAFDLSVPTSEDYCYFYGLDLYGNITYTCMPNKYNFNDYTDKWYSSLTRCTGYNEYHSETGYVLLTGDQITYHPTEVYTVGERLYPDELFASICRQIEAKANLYGDQYNLVAYGYPADCTTLKEIFAYNKEHYESAQSPTGSVVEVTDGVFLDVDGTLIIPAVGNSVYDPNGFSLDQILQSVEAGEQICSEINQLIIGNAVLQTKMRHPSDPSSNDARLSFTSVTAFGHTANFNTYTPTLPYNSKAFEVNDCFVVAYKPGADGPYTHICLVTESGVTRFDAPVKTDGTDYNASCYDFYPENGRLCYTRTIAKSSGIQYIGQIFEKCVSRDEFHRETGYVTFDGAQPVYHPTKTETVSDVYDLDEYYAQYLAFLQSVNSPISLPATLDEYLAQNALKYQRAY